MDEPDNPYSSPQEASGEARPAKPRKRTPWWLSLLQIALGAALGSGAAFAVLRLLSWLNE